MAMVQGDPGSAGPWPFDQAPDAAAITTTRVLDDAYPILVVTHYEDDHSWGFTCGTTDEPSNGAVITMAEALAIDPSLREVADLPVGWTARRESLGAQWSRGVSGESDGR